MSDSASFTPEQEARIKEICASCCRKLFRRWLRRCGRAWRRLKRVLEHFVHDVELSAHGSASRTHEGHPARFVAPVGLFHPDLNLSRVNIHSIPSFPHGARSAAALAPEQVEPFEVSDPRPVRVGLSDVMLRWLPSW
jgi:hypothetical protein